MIDLIYSLLKNTDNFGYLECFTVASGNPECMFAYHRNKKFENILCYGCYNIYSATRFVNNTFDWIIVDHKYGYKFYKLNDYLRIRMHD